MLGALGALGRLASDGLGEPAATLLARLLIVPHLFKPLHDALFVALLLEAAQRLLERFILLYANL